MWLAAEDFQRRYPRAEKLADRDKDGQPDADAIAQAIGDAEGICRARLLTRFQPEELPGDSQASSVLQAVIADLAWYQLHKGRDVVSDAATRIRDDAMATLGDIAMGKSSALLAGSPPADLSGPAFRSRGRERPALSLAVLEEIP